MPRIKLSYIRPECEYKNPASLLYKLLLQGILSLHGRLYRRTHRAAAEQSNPTSNRPGVTEAPRRNLHHSSPTHLCLLSGVTARVSGLMVATQQV
jgi:hypothetical protein